MSTNTQKYGVNIYPNTFLVIPNWVLDIPVMAHSYTDEQGTVINETLTIPQYFAKTAGNRAPVPLGAGTHSICQFESSKARGDFANIDALALQLGLTDGGDDYTLPIDTNLAYVCTTYPELTDLMATSPLNIVPEV